MKELELQKKFKHEVVLLDCKISEVECSLWKGGVEGAKGFGHCQGCEAVSGVLSSEGDVRCLGVLGEVSARRFRLEDQSSRSSAGGPQ